jgi:MFS family permease
LGLSLVLASTGTSIYAPVSQMVPRESLGMALGILKSAESISWIITPPLYGAIYEWTHNFAWSCTMFAGMGVVALVLQFILFVLREKTKPKITELTSVV